MADALMERTAEARMRFLQRPTTTEALGVRDEIVASWRRSLLYGLTPQAALPRRLDTREPDGVVTRAAFPVIEARRSALTGLSGGITLTDREGRLLARWVEDTGFARRLDARGVLPGMSIGESVIGTNSSGMCLETGRPAIVVGHEHFSDGAVMMTSAGAPIRNPITRRIVGSLNLACAATDTNGLLLPWIAELAHCVEQNLLDGSSRRQRALFDAYLSSAQDVRHPVVCVDETTVVSNAAAARILDANDHALIWEVAVARAGSRSVAEGVTLSTGYTVDVECHPVIDGDLRSGVVVHMSRVRVTAGAAPGARADAVAATGVEFAGLPGTSPRWLRFLRDSLEAHRSFAAVLLLGEPGTGKTTVARRLVETTPEPLVLDAESAGSSLLPTLRAAVQEPGRQIMLRRVDCLDGSAMSTMLVLLSSGLADGVRVLATADTSLAAATDRFLDWPGVVVSAPALRDRLADIPQLLAAMTAEILGGVAIGPKWSAEVVQVLCRTPWTANLGSLRRVVANVVSKVTGPVVRVDDLPPEILALSSRRQLCGLEQVEAHAIVAALEASGGNKRQAADALGIARSTLYRKVRALGIDVRNTTF